MSGIVTERDASESGAGADAKLIVSRPKPILHFLYFQDVRILREEAKKLHDQLDVYDGRLERLQHDDLLPKLGEAGQADISAKCTLIRQLLDNITINVAPVRAPEQLRDYNKALAVLDSLRQELGAAGAASDLSTVQHCAEQIALNANACEPEPVGPINYKYQGVVLGCTKDDQKQLRRQWRALKEQASRAVQRAQEEAEAAGSSTAAQHAAAVPPPIPPVRVPTQASATSMSSGAAAGPLIPVDSDGEEGTPHSQQPLPGRPYRPARQHAPQQQYTTGVGDAYPSQQQGARYQQPRQQQRAGPFQSMFGGVPYGDGFEQADPHVTRRQQQEQRLRDEQEWRRQMQQQQQQQQQQARARQQQGRRRGGGGLFDDGWGNAFGGSFW